MPLLATMTDQRRFAVVILAAGQGTRMRSDGKIAADIQATLALPATQEKLAGASVALWTSDPAQFRRFFPAEVAKWRDVVKKANLKLD